MATADNSYRPEKDKRLGLAMKRLLEENRLSQRQFAKLAGLTPDYVSKLVNGEISEPRRSTVEKIAAGLGITVTELWQRVEQVTAENPYRPERTKRFGLAMKRLLKENQLSQRQFAERIKLTPEHVSKLVNGEISEPRRSTVEKIAAGLGITVTEFWQRVEQVTAENLYRPERTKRFGLAMKRLLGCKDLSQRQLAKLADLTPDYVSKLVNGEIKEPRKSTVEKIAAGLGITEDELWQQVKQVDEVN